MTDLDIDRYGRVVYTRNQLYDMLLQGIDISNITRLQWHEDLDKYNTAIELNHVDAEPLYALSTKLNMPLERFDAVYHSSWFMPDEYKELDILEYVINKTPEHALNRVADELTLYAKYELLDVLRACVYLVDTMRKHNIVWGVGRGSSVSSYVLYIIGIHKIDSIKYNLDIREFLKE